MVALAARLAWELARGCRNGFPGTRHALVERDGFASIMFDLFENMDESFIHFRKIFRSYRKAEPSDLTVRGAVDRKTLPAAKAAMAR